MIDWDSVLSMIEIQDKQFKGAMIGKRFFIQCGTYELAEEVRRGLKEKGLVIKSPEDPIGTKVFPVNMDGIIMLPEGERDE